MTSTDPRDGDVAQLSINTLRFLAVDMVEKAKSGHPGAPLGQAAMAWLLWTRFLRHDPADPLWPNRDRFILSCGHASALLYGLLHLAGYDLPLTVPPGLDPDELVALFARDKKAVDGITFVLDGPDGVEPVRITDPQVLRDALTDVT